MIACWDWAGEPGRVEVAFGDDDGGTGEPGAACLQGDGEVAAWHPDVPGPVAPVRRGGRGGDGAGAARTGFAGAALVYPHGHARRTGHLDQFHVAALGELPRIQSGRPGQVERG